MKINTADRESEVRSVVGKANCGSNELVVDLDYCDSGERIISTTNSNS